MSQMLCVWCLDLEEASIFAGKTSVELCPSVFFSFFFSLLSVVYFDSIIISIFAELRML